MAQITTDIATFLALKKAQAIHPIPAALPMQRGPSCGFYALAYVMNYWHERFQLHGGDYATKKPLPPRTVVTDPPNAPRTPQQKQAKLEAVQKKHEYTSLRHYGKFNNLTLVGSVFNADDLLKAAKGESSQYAGQFDGTVVTLSDTNTLQKVVKKLLDWECPVIVPFDVSADTATYGEPVQKQGEAAHWVTIIGWYDDNGTDYAVYYNWGGFFHAKLDAFAASNAQLTSNKYVSFMKYETSDAGKVYEREFMTKSRVQESAKLGWDMSPVTGRAKVHAPEYNDPTQGGKRKEGMPDMMDSRSRMIVGGLRDRVVAVYRKEDGKEMAGVLG